MPVWKQLEERVARLFAGALVGMDGKAALV